MSIEEVIEKLEQDREILKDDILCDFSSEKDLLEQVQEKKEHQSMLEGKLCYVLSLLKELKGETYDE